MNENNFSWNDFKRQIEHHIKELRDENNEAMKTGNTHTMLCNCNELKGIDFVMNKLHVR